MTFSEARAVAVAVNALDQIDAVQTEIARLGHRFGMTVAARNMSLPAAYVEEAMDAMRKKALSDLTALGVEA